MKEAFISAGDKNFYTHPGYDPVGMAKRLCGGGLGRQEHARRLDPSPSR